MFTLKLFKNSLLSGVNSSRIASSRSISLFKKPNEEKAKKDEEDLFDEPEPEKFSFLDDEEILDPEERERKIEKMRNKSRLRPAHRNMLHDLKPYEQEESWIHTTLKYKRMQYGRLGAASGVDPRICFYTATELADKEEYRRVANPHTIQEMIKINEAIKQKKKENIQKREEMVAKNLAKLEQWQSDFLAKKNKKEEEARIAKENKDRLIEEVRRHFGFQVHPKDERFKELLEKKEKEQKKALKDAKRQAKEAKMLEKIATSNKQVNEDTQKSSEGQ